MISSVSRLSGLVGHIYWSTLAITRTITLAINFTMYLAMCKNLLSFHHAWLLHVYEY